MGRESRVSRENEVFEDGEALGAGTAPAVGAPSPADAIPPKPGGDDEPADADVDETLAGGLRDEP